MYLNILRIFLGSSLAKMENVVFKNNDWKMKWLKICSEHK
jgi:hypothetical protein